MQPFGAMSYLIPNKEPVNLGLVPSEGILLQVQRTK